MQVEQIMNVFSTWHVIRASGLTAYLLLFVISACGLVLSLQLLPVKHRAQAMAVHKTAAIACVAFTLLHGLTLLIDKYVAFSLADILLPWWADGYGNELISGIAAFYILLIITIVSIPGIMKAAGAAVWRKAHYAALPGFWLALYHGIAAGTDTGSPAVTALYVLTGCAMLVLCGLKVRRLAEKRRCVHAYSAGGRRSAAG